MLLLQVRRERHYYPETVSTRALETMHSALIAMIAAATNASARHSGVKSRFQRVVIPSFPRTRPYPPFFVFARVRHPKMNPRKGQADGYARELWRRLRQSSHTTSSSGHNSSNNNNKTKHTEGAERKKNAHALLEASLRCRHEWLCREAFREASSVMGRGDGEGLPSHPRELTALLVLLRRLLSVVFEAVEDW